MSSNQALLVARTICVTWCEQLKFKSELLYIMCASSIVVACYHWKPLFALFHSVLVWNFVPSTVLSCTTCTLPIIYLTLLPTRLVLSPYEILRAQRHSEMMFLTAVSFSAAVIQSHKWSHQIGIFKIRKNDRNLSYGAVSLYWTSCFKQQHIWLLFGRCLFHISAGTCFFDSSWFLCHVSQIPI